MTSPTPAPELAGQLAREFAAQRAAAAAELATDRIKPPSNLWESYTGEDAEVIGVLFNRAAELLQREGYDRYSKTEDETSVGRTIFEALTYVATEHVTTSAARYVNSAAFLAPDMVKRDVEALTEEMELRLDGVLLVTGQAQSLPMSGLDSLLWAWTRDVAHWRGHHAQYRGQADVIRLLKLAAVMTMTVETMR
jgi:hypothetical protein